MPTFEIVDRKGLKAEAKTLLRGAEVNVRAFTALYLGIVLLLNLADLLANGGAAPTLDNVLGLFVSILTTLIGQVLSVGFILYCMTIRLGQRAEFLTLFDGFSLVGRVLVLFFVEAMFILLWSMLFVIPGIIAAYRYRFAYYNLCENPALGALDALNLSKRQTRGYKSQLLMLDLSYLGWTILSGLPSGIFTGMATYNAYLTLFETGVAGAVAQTPMWLLLVSALWTVGVSLFYLPTYQCTELSYYETAKRTSGVTPNFPTLPTDGEPGDGGQF